MLTENSFPNLYKHMFVFKYLFFYFITRFKYRTSTKTKEFEHKRNIQILESFSIQE